MSTELFFVKLNSIFFVTIEEQNRTIFVLKIQTETKKEKIKKL